MLARTYGPTIKANKMGCDIHMRIETKENGKWVKNEKIEPYWGRNYITFSVLADVRRCYDSFDVIVEPRGLPKDLDYDPDGWEFGDHSFSWLTLTEILNYNWDHVIEEEGFVDSEQFETWDQTGERPSHWCAAVGGGSVEHCTHHEMRRRLREPYPWEHHQHAYTLLHWQVSLRERCVQFLEFVDELKGLSDNTDDVRIVFGFDN